MHLLKAAARLIRGIIPLQEADWQWCDVSGHVRNHVRRKEPLMVSLGAAHGELVEP